MAIFFSGAGVKLRWLTGQVEEPMTGWERELLVARADAGGGGHLFA